MKNFIRTWLIVECFAFFVMFVRDLEAMNSYSKVLGYPPTTEEWLWLVCGTVIPMVSMGIAIYYAFKHTWANRFFLAGAAVVYGVFVLLGEKMTEPLSLQYVTLPAYITLPLLIAFVVCVLLQCIPHRHWIAFGAIMALGVGMIACYAIREGFGTVLDWTPTYVLPLIPLALLGRIMPDKPVERKPEPPVKKKRK